MTKYILTAGTVLMTAGFAFSAHALTGNSMPVAAGMPAITATEISASQTDGAKSFVESMAKQGIDFLANPGLSADQRKAEFKKLLQGKFDIRSIGRFALGRYWNSATDAQKKEYQSLFEKMIVDVYSRRFGDYNGQDFQVGSARPEGQADSIVTTYIVPSDGPKVTVDWRIRYKDGNYKVIDVIVEGVSMATTQRSEFASIIQRGGGQIDALLSHLRG